MANIGMKKLTRLLGVSRISCKKEKKSKLEYLKGEVSDIQRTISEISLIVQSNEDIVESNDLAIAMSYTSENTRFGKGPDCNDVPVLTFDAKKIHDDEFAELFGSLATVKLEVLRIPSPVMSPEADQVLSNEPQIAKTLRTGILVLRDIAPQDIEKIWAHGKKDTAVKLFDINDGQEVKSFNVLYWMSIYGYHSNGISVAKSGDLIYCCSLYNTVNIVVANRSKILVNLHEWSPRGVCITSSGDMLVTMTHEINAPKVVRYTESLERQTIQYDGDGKPIFSNDDNLYIAENTNRDICVSGDGKLIVVKDTGDVRFIYVGYSTREKDRPMSPLSGRGRRKFAHTGHYWSQDFSPRGVATDSHGHILTADSNNKCVHVIDQAGKFQRYIDCGIKEPWGLCIGSDGFLFVADSRSDSGEIDKIKYLK